MCEIMERYMEEARTEGMAKGMAEERLQAISRLLEKGFDRQIILSLNYTEEEYQKAKSLLQEKA